MNVCINKYVYMQVLLLYFKVFLDFVNKNSIYYKKSIIYDKKFLDSYCHGLILWLNKKILSTKKLRISI